MNMRDDIELSMLAETGDMLLAEACGFAIDYTWESLCALIGIDFAALKAMDEL